MKVHFEGLCAIAPGPAPAFVLTPVGHHTPHTSLMAVDAEHLDMDYTTWLPDLVIRSLDDRVMALWRLGRTVVSLGEPGEARWGIVDPHFLNLVTLNPTARYNECPAATSGGVIKLGAGDLSTDENLPPIRIIKMGPTPTTIVAKDTPNQRLTWTGAAVVDGHRAGRLVFQPVPSGREPEFWVTNTSTGDGLSHFHNYYDLVRKDKDDGNVVLEFLDPKEVRFFGHGLNCVPPVRLPQA